jgi:regulator of protease activity HflC (stomatin/prohibitin superfamily)
MGVIIGIFILLITIGMFIWGGISLYRERQVQGTIGLILGIVGFIAFIFIPFSFHQIETGEVAVVKVWGEAKEIKGEGLNFDNWISTQYIKYDLKTQEISAEISAYSQDAQSMTASLKV